MSRRIGDLTIEGIEPALRYIAGKAGFRHGWHVVRSGKRGYLKLAWRVIDGVQELAVSRDDQMPDAGDLYDVRKALSRANLEEVEIEKHEARRTVRMRLAITQEQLPI